MISWCCHDNPTSQTRYQWDKETKKGILSFWDDKGFVREQDNLSPEEVETVRHDLDKAK